MKNSIKYEVVDSFLKQTDFAVVTQENEMLHAHSSHNIFSELSSGKTTVNILSSDEKMQSPPLILGALTSQFVKQKIQNFLGIREHVYTLLDFKDSGGHSFFHRMFPSSFLGLHVDRSYLPGVPMVKVANGLFYTSPMWRTDFGGHLYIQNGILSRQSERIDYLPNRLIILLHTSSTFHRVSRLSKESPVRYSSYMDYYIPISLLKTLPIYKKLWIHETVYLPEFMHLWDFMRGINYSVQLCKYLRRRRF